MLHCCLPSRQECSWNGFVNLRIQHIPQHLKHYNCKIKWNLVKFSKKAFSELIYIVQRKQCPRTDFYRKQANSSAINKIQYPNLYWKHSPLQLVLIHIYTLFTESILTVSISVCLEHLPTPGVSSSLDHQDHHLHSP